MTPFGRNWRLLLSASLLLLLLLVTGRALAQTPSPNDVNAVAKELWCPLCNGVRLDSCELQACVQMRELIAQKLAAGENKDQIKAYFVSQYGDVVLGAPANQGFNRLAWLLPVAGAASGLVILVCVVRAWSRRTAASAVQATAESTPVEEDEYLQRVNEQLRRYD